MPSKPFAISSDWHAHNWAAFNRDLSDGTTERMHILCSALSESCDTLLKLGGNQHIVTGDIFHSRSGLAPSVVNVLRDTLIAEQKKGIEFIMIPGNHDLEFDLAHEAASAVTLLRDCGVTVHAQCHVDNERMRIFVPWVRDLEHLMLILNNDDDLHFSREQYSVFMHAPVNGVRAGLNGIDAQTLLGLGFKSIYTGHYHHARDMIENDPGRVVSVGALTHQSFRDIDSVAGFLIVDDFGCQHYTTSAPKFVDFSSKRIDDIEGNYVRIATRGYSKLEQSELRMKLIDNGAKDVVVSNTPSAKKSERTVTVAESVSLEQSVSEYCAKAGDSDDVVRLAIECLEGARLQ